MDLQKFYDNVLKDLKVELKDEFDRNFQRKAFFDKAWPKNKLINQRGSMMMRNGHLRNSIESRIQGDKIIFSSSLPYASIHNEGGEITVTPKMKSYSLKKWATIYAYASFALPTFIYKFTNKNNMNIKKFMQNTLNDLKIELTDEFDWSIFGFTSF